MFKIKKIFLSKKVKLINNIKQSSTFIDNIYLRHFKTQNYILKYE